MIPIAYLPDALTENEEKCSNKLKLNAQTTLTYIVQWIQSPPSSWNPDLKTNILMIIRINITKIIFEVEQSLYWIELSILNDFSKYSSSHVYKHLLTWTKTKKPEATSTKDATVDINQPEEKCNKQSSAVVIKTKKHTSEIGVSAKVSLLTLLRYALVTS